MIKKIIAGVFVLVLLVAGFIIWSKFFCPTCRAVEQNLPSPVLNPAFQIESQAPHFVLETLEGSEVSLADFAGKNVLLVFWDTYCGYCEKERPDLNRFTEEQEDRIEVLAVSQEPKEMLKRYVEEKEVNFTVFFDPGGKTQNKYLALGTPSHFLIDKQGEIVATRPGYASYQDLLILTEFLEER